MIADPFLTDIDPQAAIKGSRDPLGIQPIWTHLGRRVVGNLTTVSNSVRDFTTTILGYYFAERVAKEKNGDGGPACAHPVSPFIYCTTIHTLCVDTYELISKTDARYRACCDHR